MPLYTGMMRAFTWATAYSLLLHHAAPLLIPRLTLESSRIKHCKKTIAPNLAFLPAWHAKSGPWKDIELSLLHSRVNGEAEQKKSRKKRKRRTWEEYKQDLAVFQSTHGHCRVPSGYPENPTLPNWMSQQRKNYRLWMENKSSPLTADQVGELVEIGFVWDAKKGPAHGKHGAKVNEELWNQRLGELEAFKSIYGHCHVPQEFADNPALGNWVSHQRHQYRRYRSNKSSRLNSERIRALENIGFEWTPKRLMHASKETKNGLFCRRLEELKDFKSVHGHCDVRSGDLENLSLANWAARQRRKYRLFRQGKPSPLTPAQIRALDDLGFAWEVKGRKRKPKAYKTWSEHLNELKEFKKKHGHCRVYRGYQQDQALYNWVIRQRQFNRLLKKKRPSQLTSDRIRELEEIGFEWETSRDHSNKAATWDKRWNERLEELVAFKAVHGHCRVPLRYPENMRLSRWVVTQRKLYRLVQENEPSTLTPKRIRQLEDVGFEFETTRSGEIWDIFFNDLMVFRAKHGHCRVPRRYEENQRLSNWFQRQKQNYRLLQRNEPSTLTAERIRALKDAGFDF